MTILIKWWICSCYILLLFLLFLFLLFDFTFILDLFQKLRIVLLIFRVILANAFQLSTNLIFLTLFMYYFHGNLFLFALAVVNHQWAIDILHIYVRIAAINILINLTLQNRSSRCIWKLLGLTIFLDQGWNLIRFYYI